MWTFHLWTLSLVSREFESAVVKAECDHLVDCKASIFGEARGESLHTYGLVRVKAKADSKCADLLEGVLAFHFFTHLAGNEVDRDGVD